MGVPVKRKKDKKYTLKLLLDAIDENIPFKFLKTYQLRLRLFYSLLKVFFICKRMIQVIST